jgi:HAD superfamily hydrolase (TIGR01458 family)
MNSPQALILDLDGTLYQQGSEIPGAREALAQLRDSGLPMRYVTNTTRRPRRTVFESVRSYGFEIELHELLTAPVAAAGWLADRGIERLHLLLMPETFEDFADFDVTGRNPQAVVVGDLGREWNYDLLNTAFGYLLDGAELVAIQKNRYWRNDQGLGLDAGPFIAALEYAADTTATIVGKPSREFFTQAAQSMGVDLSEAAMIGDDLESDVGGAQNAGARGVLVRTGKFRQDVLERSDVVPDLIIDSIADLPEALARQSA